MKKFILIVVLAFVEVLNATDTMQSVTFETFVQKYGKEETLNIIKSKIEIIKKVKGIDYSENLKKMHEELIDKSEDEQVTIITAFLKQIYICMRETEEGALKQLRFTATYEVAGAKERLEEESRQLKKKFEEDAKALVEELAKSGKTVVSVEHPAFGKISF